MRRVLNSFLQFIERDESESLIVAATIILSCLIKLYLDDLTMLYIINFQVIKKKLNY